jgi:hypothetical protein
MVGPGLAMKQDRPGWTMNRKRERLDISVCGRLPLARFRTLEAWCGHSLRKRAELVGIVLDRVLEIYEEEATADEPLEFFVRKLHLGRDL